MNKIPFCVCVCVYKRSFSVSIHWLLDTYSVSISVMRKEANSYVQGNEEESLWRTNESKAFWKTPQ